MSTRATDAVRVSAPSFGGVDVGGTTIKVGALRGQTFSGEAVDLPTPHGADAVLNAVVAIAAHMTSSNGTAPAGIGVALPGIVDERRGTAVLSSNLGWRDVPFRDRLAERIAVPIALGHDVRCGGLAEARLGAARGYRDLAFVPIGTGIAAALVLDGNPYAGGGWAGELGHVDVGHEEPCPCGRTGCLEAVASGSAIGRRYTQRTGVDVRGSHTVVHLMRSGDPAATAVWEEALDALAGALADLTSLIAPEVVVLGGGVPQAGPDLFLEPLTRRVHARLSFHRRPKLVSAALGARAGAIGAALLARDRFGAQS